MPANIAHMLICHKAVNRVKNLLKDDNNEFIQSISNPEIEKNYQAYLNLGSMTPDLFYYLNWGKSLMAIFIDKYILAAGVEPWSYNLHSPKAVDFPLNLIQIIFRDLNKNIFDDQDCKKLAFVAGILTHIAADQIIHPKVTEISGPYYRSGQNRITHRECEVNQDYFIYRYVYVYENKTGPDFEFSKQPFKSWANCGDMEDWFYYFIQRGFSESYNIFPDKDMIEKSIKHLLTFLNNCNRKLPLFPYWKYERKFRTNDATDKRKYFDSIHYLTFYRIAVELSAVYILALYEVYLLLKKGEYNDDIGKRFISIVKGTDLLIPLETKMLDRSIEAITASSNEQTVNISVKYDLRNKLLNENNIKAIEDNEKIVLLK